MKHGQINALDVATIGYIAGLIDADGTVTATTQTSIPHPMVLVVNSELSLISWLRATIGAGCAYETKSRPTRPDQDPTNWNRVHRFQLGGAKAQALLRLVRPQLRVKAAQADLVLQLPARGLDYAVRCPDELRERAKLLLKEIRLLNARGIKA